jgi:hypothetical protein
MLGRMQPFGVPNFGKFGYQVVPNVPSVSRILANSATGVPANHRRSLGG